MKLAVSNIAWTPETRHDAYALLAKYGVRGLEIAPGLFFHAAADPFDPDNASAEMALGEMHDAGLQLVSMQSLLFGVNGAALFGTDLECAAFEDGIKRAIALAGRFSIPNLVFGSPKQRYVPEEMEIEDALGHAVKVFRRLGDYALKEGTLLGIEFNPKTYGTNFINDAEDALAIVKRANHPALTMIMDVGALKMNDRFDTIETLAQVACPVISHVHLSEPNLDPAPADAESATRVINAMENSGYERWLSVEMKMPPGGMSGLEARLQILKQAADRSVKV